MRAIKVFVYRNLHKDCWSIKSRETGTVLAHAFELIIKNAQFKVSEAGRQRVLKTKRKNVHAGVTGELVISPFECDEYIDQHQQFQTCRVTYDPYKYSSFVKFTKPDEIVKTAPAVYFDNFCRVWTFS